ncbi:hypothetical protein MM300_16225 [Evansella sp. LMS18]|uniref:hypothetical protein n=1 Tax=Evansella sp. LMS18 TaxID=2924033 RepID=UPI0020D19FAD|nr:hypothetical protein [Evansella sp. LMS18]UTR09431.1 hypothetical protein MM300_16225 [Evansella sp. LMS18]
MNIKTRVLSKQAKKPNDYSDYQWEQVSDVLCYNIYKASWEAVVELDLDKYFKDIDEYKSKQKMRMSSRKRKVS